MKTLILSVVGVVLALSVVSEVVKPFNDARTKLLAGLKISR